MSLDILTRREILNLGSRIGTGAVIAYSLPHAIAHYDIPDSKETQNVLGQSRIEEALRKFDGLPQSEQNEILSRLENYILEQTKIGTVVKSVSTALQAIQIPIVENPSLSLGSFYYDTYNNTIYWGNVPPHLIIQMCLLDQPVQLSKSHEGIHAVQDLSSKWDRFETFFRSFVPADSVGPAINIFIPEDKVIKFATDFLENPGAGNEEAIKGFAEVWNSYDSEKPARKIIREVQAYLSVEAYINPDRMYNRLNAQSDYRRSLEKITKRQFDTVFRATLELLGMLDPVSAAKFVGANGNSLVEYSKAIDKLKTEMGIKDAYQKGVNRQRTLSDELNSIALEAIKYIDSIPK